MEDLTEGTIRLLQHLLAALRQLDVDDAPVGSGGFALDKTCTLQPVGDPRRPAGAVDQLGRDLAHLKRMAGRHLQPHQELELRPREVHLGLQAVLQEAFDDPVRLLQVDPGGDLVLICRSPPYLHVRHAIWNSFRPQPCSNYSC